MPLRRARGKMGRRTVLSILLRLTASARNGEWCWLLCRFSRDGRNAVQRPLPQHAARGLIMARRRFTRDERREHRIAMEVIVDAYGGEEQAMGWYYYLEEQLQFPFDATCIAKREVSPLRVKDRVEVIGMPSEDECSHEMFVSIRWDRKKGLAVPLAQLKPARGTDERTREAVADWHYWAGMGYEF